VNILNLSLGPPFLNAAVGWDGRSGKLTSNIIVFTPEVTLPDPLLTFAGPDGNDPNEIVLVTKTDGGTSTRGHFPSVPLSPPAFSPRIRGFPVCLESSFLLSIQGRVLRVVYDENLDWGFRRYEFEPKLFLNKGEIVMISKHPKSTAAA
jgi:hypothetical protein